MVAGNYNMACPANYTDFDILMPIFLIYFSIYFLMFFNFWGFYIKIIVYIYKK